MNNFHAYQKVRKLNPDLYYDQTTQSQMKRDAQRLGEKFFEKSELNFREDQNDKEHC